MTTPRQSRPPSPPVPADTAKEERQQADLDEGLDETFPASDPVAVSITVIDRPAPRG